MAGVPGHRYFGGTEIDVHLQRRKTMDGVRFSLQWAKACAKAHKLIQSHKLIQQFIPASTGAGVTRQGKGTLPCE